MNKRKSFQILFAFLTCIVLVACSAEKLAFNDKKSARGIQKKYSTVIGVGEKEINNVRLYFFLDEWVGVPYRYAGKNKKGVDCSGFSGILQKEVFGKTATGSSASIHNQCEKINRDELREGDLIFFKIESKEVSHMGVYLQNNKFAHAVIKRGVAINDLNEPYYKKYFWGFGRLP